MFERKELQDIRSRALEAAVNVNNRCWIDAYRNLAYATDRLDAMNARSEDEKQNGPIEDEP